MRVTIEIQLEGNEVLGFDREFRAMGRRLILHKGSTRTDKIISIGSMENPDEFSMMNCTVSHSDGRPLSWEQTEQGYSI